MASKYLTVVYLINNESAFDGARAKIIESFNDTMGRDWRITAVSGDHEIRRLELLEQALNGDDIETASAIIDHPDIGNIFTLDGLVSCEEPVYR